MLTGFLVGVLLASLLIYFNNLERTYAAGVIRIASLFIAFAVTGALIGGYFNV